MNFFKKMLGFSGGLADLMKNTKINGTLYRAVKDSRNIMYLSSKSSFA